jgi:cephalosporin-C deacetylase
MVDLDAQLAELMLLKVLRTARPDFDAFWQEKVTLFSKVPKIVSDTVVEYPIEAVEAHDLVYESFDGTAVHAWYLRPACVVAPIPVVVNFHGHTCSRGAIAEFAPWILAGAAVFSMDFRMQGGATGSAVGFSSSSSADQFCFGIENPNRYYFLSIMADILASLAWLRSKSDIDTTRMALHGGSQGGGISLLTAALDQKVACCMADVPSLCRMEKRIFDRSGSGRSIADLLRNRPDLLDTVCNTLSYFDVMNHAGSINCPVLVSVGLKDPVCTPDTVYAAYNNITAPKEMAVYPFGEHDGGGWVHMERKIAWFTEMMKR